MVHNVSQEVPQYNTILVPQMVGNVWPNTANFPGTPPRCPSVFSSRYNTTIHGSQFPAILHMTAMYRIHWISMWKYTINNNLLDREFLVKWWDSLRFKEIIEQIYKDLPPPIQKAITCKTTIAHRTRSQTSLDSIQISGKSSKEL